VIEAGTITSVWTLLEERVLRPYLSLVRSFG
jgi:hypothetical protein